MVKIILEKEDIITLITNKYNSAEIISGLEDDLEVVIKVTDYKPTTQPPPPSNNIDTMTLKNREETIPGGAMGRKRNSLPVF